MNSVTRTGEERKDHNRRFRVGLDDGRRATSRTENQKKKASEMSIEANHLNHQASNTNGFLSIHIGG